MNKAYNRITWENKPSINTPINEGNLNKLSSAVDVIDDRVVKMDQTKLDKETAYGLLANFEINEKTGIITLTYLNGVKATIDTALEKIAMNWRYDRSSEKMIITLIDETTQEIDLKELITNYDFSNSATVSFSVVNGKVEASIIDGSITEEKLRPNYLADIKAEVAKANNAGADADTAKSYAVGGTGTRQGEDQDNARYYSEQAKKAVGIDPYTKEEIDDLLTGKAAAKHKHYVKDISDFPSAMPAAGGDASTVGGHTVDANVPANANFANTWRPLGTTKDTACAGNDSRLSDARTPKSHTHTLGDSKIVVSNSATPTGDYSLWFYYE